MANSFTLDDTFAFSDFRVFLERAVRFADATVRLVANHGVLAAYVGVLAPAGLLDRTPTVLGLRTWGIRAGEVSDSVVSVRAVLDRLARTSGPWGEGQGDDGGDGGIRVPLPVVPATASWAGVTPPRGGWEHVGSISEVDLRVAAEAGIAEVATAIPGGMGEILVRKARSEVWGRPLPQHPALPAGAAFAAESLGFIPPALPGSLVGAVGGHAEVFTSGAWQRVSLSRGHVVVRGTALRV
ncbi:hypothetical protein GCM10022198_07980 [Klugiella xanthotipulae]|uniref:Uncharacterized protein n=1 Tax=Klugiella xanthotipulae TaxID=244735 RepID=A0A543HT15_9MICO|nr:hypothetical protein [Klugiella xanthotipulae]TQM61442.1 hypothetical protein FB466_2396 [Klugiella xanthotipulae]